MKTQTSQPEEYDVLVLGSGGGGKLIAWTLGKRGMKVGVVERKYIGGSCPNIACLPSKNVIQSAKVASYFFRSAEFGITKDNTRINMAAVRERKRKMVTGLVDLHLDLYKKSGAQLIMGSGRFIAPKTIEVTTAEGKKSVLHGKKVVINIGTHSTIDSTPGLAGAKPLTHVEALELDRIPEHLLVIGGGYVGLEFAQAMRRFGSRVTVIERNGRLLHREDEDISSAMHELFKDEGIDVITNAPIDRVEGKSGESVKLYIKRDGSEIIVQGSDILVATGRTPNTNGIGLGVAGVQLTSHGYIKVNERLETTAPDVWAAGDCAGSPQFTHISEHDFRVIHDNILGGQRVTTGRQVPFCMFTDPEFARIGLNETEAKEKGIAYRVAKIPMSAILRTRTISEPRGFLKTLVDAKSDRILGFIIFGADGGEVMPTVQVAMLAGIPYTTLADAIFAHPTMHEGLNSLFAAVPAKT
ncbi:MAG TPA: FAD-dependent oxidoreductase [Pseudomonadales bacterium]|nr:FAD-dependent oxidoreductase [Pseudomonadales bacterium]